MSIAIYYKQSYFRVKFFDITHYEYFDLNKYDIEFVQPYCIRFTKKSKILLFMVHNDNFKIRMRMLNWFISSKYVFKNICFRLFKNNASLKNKTKSLKYFKIKNFKVKNRYFKGHKKN